RKLTKGNLELELPELSYRLLVCLVENAPNVVPHNVLLEQVWQGKVVSEDTIKKRVSRLRDVIQSEENQALIIAERGLGYRLSIGVTTIEPVVHCSKPLKRLNVKVIYVGLLISVLIGFSLLFLNADNRNPKDQTVSYTTYQK